MNTIHKNRKRGFTLLEIILVIATIGILAAIVLVAINPNRQIAQVRNAQRRSDVNTIYKALEQYLIDNGGYPTGITSTLKDICNTGAEQVGGATDCTNKVDLRALVPTYIAAIPRDPEGLEYFVRTSNNRVSVTPTISISSWTELAGITSNNAYKLMRNLTTLDQDYSIIAGPLANGGQGWAPKSIVVRLDGNGYSIDGLTINRPSSNEVGMFGVLQSGSLIFNLKLTNVSITGQDRVGAIAGRASGGLIENFTLSGSLSGRDNVGGYIGYVGYSSGVNSVTARRCTMLGTVLGRNGVGGIFGYGEISDVITDNCINLSSVTGVNGVGGIMGSNVYSYIGTVGTVSVGPVMGSTDTNAVVGSYNGGYHWSSASYWDTQATGRSVAIPANAPNRNHIGLTTSQMQGTNAPINMNNLNWTNIWQEEIGYPSLR